MPLFFGGENGGMPTYLYVDACNLYRRALKKTSHETYVRRRILYGNSTTGILALGFHGILTLPRTSCNALTFPGISGKASLRHANCPTKSREPTSGNRKAGNVSAAFAA
jgi:hypothetical protein